MNDYINSKDIYKRNSLFAKTIAKHIKNGLEEELNHLVVANFATTTSKYGIKGGRSYVCIIRM